MTNLKRFVGTVLPYPWYEILGSWKRNPDDKSACIAFILNRGLFISFAARIQLIRQLYLIFFENPEIPHKQAEVLLYIETILCVPPNSRGVIVEAGCFKGISTAKFSLAAKLAGRQLVVFDSFQGIPKNAEDHGETIYGTPAEFGEGDYAASLEEVKANVSRYGEIDCCRFIPGWFDDTLPRFNEPVAAVYLDVDLVSSTRTCLRYLYPLLEPGGRLYSQDGHLPRVLELFNDENFWRDELGCDKPNVEGAGKRTLIGVTKTVPPAA